MIRNFYFQKNGPSSSRKCQQENLKIFKKFYQNSKINIFVRNGSKYLCFPKNNNIHTYDEIYMLHSTCDHVAHILWFSFPQESKVFTE